MPFCSAIDYLKKQIIRLLIHSSKIAVQVSAYQQVGVAIPFKFPF